MVNLTDNTASSKEKRLEIITEKLPELRAKIGLPLNKVSNIIGISRQTYCLIETHKQNVLWNTFK